MTVEYTFNEALPLEVAIRRIKSYRGKNKTLFLSCSQQAPIAEREGYHFLIYGSVRVTHKAAITFVQEAYRNFADRGALVAIRELDRCVFIG